MNNAKAGIYVRLVSCLAVAFAIARCYAKYESFDCCGIDNCPSNINPFLDARMEDGVCNAGWRCFVNNRNFGVSASNVQARVDSCDDRFYPVFVEAEISWAEGDIARMRRCFSLLRRMLELEDSYSDLLGTLNSRVCRNRLCYMLARMVNYRGDDRLRITNVDIDLAFPRIELGPDSNVIRFRQETFRRMLKVGVAIERQLKESGRLPARLVDIKSLPKECMKDGYGEDFEYRHEGEYWKLYSGCGSRFVDFQSIRAFVPCVETAGVIPFGVWFSSSYSASRCMLYRNNELKLEGENVVAEWFGCGGRVKLLQSTDVR